MAGKKPKAAHEMTSDEIAKRVFPPEVHQHLKKLAAETDALPKRKAKPGQPEDSSS